MFQNSRHLVDVSELRCWHSHCRRMIIPLFQHSRWCVAKVSQKLLQGFS